MNGTEHESKKSADQFSMTQNMTANQSSLMDLFMSISPITLANATCGPSSQNVLISQIPTLTNPMEESTSSMVAQHAQKLIQKREQSGPLLMPVTTECNKHENHLNVSDNIKNEIKDELAEPAPENPSNLKIEINSDFESEDEEERTPNETEKCEGCGRFTHEDDTSAIDEEHQKKQERPLMSKKKSHRHKHFDYQWIGCENCRAWFHQGCSGLEQYEYYLYEKFHCEKCVPIVGPSVEYKKVAPNRHRWYDKEEIGKPMEIGSEMWIHEMQNWAERIPPPGDKEVCIVEDGHAFKKKFEELGGAGSWDKVFLVKKKEGLDMVMPEPGCFDIEDVVQIMGPDYEVDTIDVYNQNTFSMKLSTFLKKFRDKGERKHLYNFLSLEFSGNPTMRQIAKPPKFVQDISIVNMLWPDENCEMYRRLLQAGNFLEEEQKPKVEQFCLSGMAHSYTDYHIDFGGSSVYYHIFKGQKIFYIVEPTDENLEAYVEHETSNWSKKWFGDKIPGQVKRVVVNEGETLLIPAGWIHAVYTPVDSLVFGGNFLHVGNMEMQLKIYNLENRIRKIIKSDAKFYFPNFEFLHWMYARNVLLERIKEANEEETDLRENKIWVDPFRIVEDVEMVTNREVWKSASAILPVLKEWVEREERKESGEYEYMNFDNKKKILVSLERQYRVQKKIQENIKLPKRLKKKRKSGESTERDDEYNPAPQKRYTKKPKVESHPQINSSIHKEGEPSDQPVSSDSLMPPIKLKIGAAPTSDQVEAAQMFNHQHTSSGRKVKVNKNVIDYCGSQLNVRDEEIPQKPMKTFHELDVELERCLAKEAGEVTKKLKPPKAPKEKSEKPPGKRKTGPSNIMTTKQRLAKKLKM